MIDDKDLFEIIQKSIEDYFEREEKKKRKNKSRNQR